MVAPQALVAVKVAAWPLELSVTRAELRTAKKQPAMQVSAAYTSCLPRPQHEHAEAIAGPNHA